MNEKGTPTTGGCLCGAGATPIYRNDYVAKTTNGYYLPFAIRK